MSAFEDLKPIRGVPIGAGFTDALYECTICHALYVGWAFGEHAVFHFSSQDADALQSQFDLWLLAKRRDAEERKAAKLRGRG